MVRQYEELSCPFCDQGRISALHIPSAFTVKHVKSGKGSANIPRKSSEVWLIRSGCNVCGKSSEEVEKKLKVEGMI